MLRRNECSGRLDIAAAIAMDYKEELVLDRGVGTDMYPQLHCFREDERVLLAEVSNPTFVPIKHTADTIEILYMTMALVVEAAKADHVILVMESFVKVQNLKESTEYASVPVEYSSGSFDVVEALQVIELDADGRWYVYTLPYTYGDGPSKVKWGTQTHTEDDFTVYERVLLRWLDRGLLAVRGICAMPETAIQIVKAAIGTGGLRCKIKSDDPVSTGAAATILPLGADLCSGDMPWAGVLTDPDEVCPCDSGEKFKSCHGRAAPPVPDSSGELALVDDSGRLVVLMSAAEAEYRLRDDIDTYEILFEVMQNEIRVVSILMVGDFIVLGVVIEDEQPLVITYDGVHTGTYEVPDDISMLIPTDADLSVLILGWREIEAWTEGVLFTLALRSKSLEQRALLQEKLSKALPDAVVRLS